MYIIISVMILKSNRDLLSHVLKMSQAGQASIRSVLDVSMCPSLRTTLESQLREYDSIETEAYTIAAQRGWELQELAPGLRFMQDLTARLRLNGRNTESSIAGMIIQGNTKAMIQSLKGLHQLDGVDAHIQTISQRLLDCETANIQKMRGFL